MTHIYLVGMTGCGKSYWGKPLAELLNIPYVNLDDIIEQHLGKSINAAFTDNDIDWPGFRQLESIALKEAAQSPVASVITLGGGTPCFLDNISVIHRTGFSVYLRCPIHILYQRLQQEKEHRPMIKDFDDGELLSWLQVTLTEREPYYLQADINIDSLRPSWTLVKQLYEARLSGQIGFK